MFQLIRRLFGWTDRAEAAGERIAVALEGLAGDVESMRAAFRARIGAEEVVTLPAPKAAEEEPGRNGAGRRKAAAR